MADGGQERPAGSEEVNYVKKAFNSQYNWIGIIGAAAFAVVSGSALPLLLAGGLELMYLSIVPQNARYQRLIRSREYAAEKRRAASRFNALAAQLPADMRSRYQNLQDVCTGIRRNYAQLSSTSQIFAGQMEERLGGLMQGFLRLLISLQLHRDYLRTASPEEIEQEIGALERSSESDPAKVREINARRIEILNKRLEKFRKIQENHQVIEAQCAAMQDVLELIRDQSVTMKDPQQVSEQLGGLVRDVEQTEETVREVESIFEMAAPDLDLSLPEPVRESGPGGQKGTARRKARS